MTPVLSHNGSGSLHAYEGSLNRKDRLLSPDVSRGLTLLSILLANMATYWVAQPDLPVSPGFGGVRPHSILDTLSVVALSIFSDVRGVAMFSCLMGYGAGMIAQSMWRRGYSAKTAKKAMMRRYAVLLAIGGVHMIFLFVGDVIVFYAMAGMLFALCISLSSRQLLTIAIVMSSLSLLIGCFFVIISAGEVDLSTQGKILQDGLNSGNYIESVLNGSIIFLISPLNFIPQFLVFGPIMILGFVAARYNVLGQVDRYRRQLWTAVIVAALIMLFVGLPLGMQRIGILGSVFPWNELNTFLGAYTGPGIVAAIALACEPLQRRLRAAQAAGKPAEVPFALQGIVALGKRSMSGYIAQSVICVILFSPFTFGLLTNSGAWAVVIASFVIWLVTVAAALALEKAGKPGPVEWIHRRWGYRHDDVQPYELRPAVFAERYGTSGHHVRF